mgnify:CR=1 FL=1
MINKKIIMSGMSIVSALTLMGGATFAFFSSNATSVDNTFASGTMTLLVDDTDQLTPVPSVTGSLSVTGFVPGASTTGYVSLHNGGSIAIAEVELGADSVITANPDATGNMKEVLNLTVLVDNAVSDTLCTDGSNVTAAIDTLVGDGAGSLTLAEFDNGGVDVYDALLTGVGLAPTVTRNVCFTVTFDPGATDIYQGDAVNTSFAFTANQDVSQ